MDIEKKFNVHESVSQGKVCQLLSNGNINNLPLIKKHNKVFGSTLTVSPISAVSAEVTVSDVVDIAIDDTHILHIYSDSATSKTYGVVLTYNGTTITRGTPFQLPKYLAQLEIHNIVSGKFALIGTYQSASTYLVTINIDLLTYSISVLNETVLSSSQPSYISKGRFAKIGDRAYVAIGGNNSLVSFTYNETYTAVTINETLTIFASYTPYYTGVFCIDGFVILVYRATVNTYYRIYYSIYKIVNGVLTTISLNTQLIDNFAPENLRFFTQNGIIYLLCINGTSYNAIGWIRIKFDGVSVLTYSSVYPVSSSNAGSYNSFEFVKISDNQVVLLLSYYANSVKLLMINFAGDIVHANSVIACYNYHVPIKSITKFGGDNLKLYFALRQSESPYYIQNGVIDVEVFLPKEDLNGSVIGLANDNEGRVLLRGIYKGFTGLTVGAHYYYDSNGIVSKDNDGTYLGFAIGENKLLVHNTLT